MLIAFLGRCMPGANFSDGSSAYVPSKIRVLRFHILLKSRRHLFWRRRWSGHSYEPEAFFAANSLTVKLEGFQILEFMVVASSWTSPSTCYDGTALSTTAYREGKSPHALSHALLLFLSPFDVFARCRFLVRHGLPELTG
jgi:hypothetical protein